MGELSSQVKFLWIRPLVQVDLLLCDWLLILGPREEELGAGDCIKSALQRNEWPWIGLKMLSFLYFKQ